MKRIALMSAVVVAVALCAALPAAAAPSFNCAKAVKAAEQAICDNARLQKLDRQMATIYRKMSKHPTAYGYGRAELKADQREWLLGRNLCAWDSGCIEEAYLARLEYLATFGQ